MDEAIGTKMAGKSKQFEIGEARRRGVPKGRPEEIQMTQGKRGKDEGNGTATLSRTPMRTGYLEDVWGSVTIEQAGLGSRGVAFLGMQPQCRSRSGVGEVKQPATIESPSTFME